MCRPGGLVLVNMPFLIRIHDHPGDYWRFTPDGSRFLLTAVGLDVQWVRSWGTVPACGQTSTFGGDIDRGTRFGTRTLFRSSFGACPSTPLEMLVSRSPAPNLNA